MLITQAAAPPFYKNGYLLGCDTTREAVLIDPGDEVDELIRTVSDRRLLVRHVLLTHAHLDHITGVARAKTAFADAPVVLHAADLPLYEAIVQQGLMFGLAVQQQPPPDRFYAPDEIIRFGTHTIHVHHTPGHSPGGVCLEVADAEGEGPDLFVGDTLFAGSIGRTDLPGGDYGTLIRSIREVLFPLGDSARVYPGHGEPTTIRRERLANPFLTPS